MVTLDLKESFYLYYDPPSKKSRYIVLHMSVGSVSPSVRPPDGFRMITQERLGIDHDWQMTPIDFEVTRSKVKVTVTRNSKMVSGW